MNSDAARIILDHVVSFTKPRWEQYDTSWADMDKTFVARGYEQGGFETWKFCAELDKRGAFSISQIGLILEAYAGPRKYDRVFAGSIKAPLYMEMASGKRGLPGRAFHDAIMDFKGRPGGWFWSKLWQMLVCCNYLKQRHSGSFKSCLLNLFAKHKSEASIPDGVLLSETPDGWDDFKKKVKPWKNLLGIGENVFDFIVGDVREAAFNRNNFKIDSSNAHFLEVTGMSREIGNMTRDAILSYIRSLDLPYTLRQVNKGIFTYCSVTESALFGFCRERSKCNDCAVSVMCDKRL